MNPVTRLFPLIGLLPLFGGPPEALSDDRLTPRPVSERLPLQPASDIRLPEPVVETLSTFFSRLKDNQAQTAYFHLLDGTSIGTRKEAMDKFMEATRETIDAFGPFIAYEAVDYFQPTDHILLPVFMTRQEGKILRWQFVFFRPAGTTWTLANLRVDDWRNYLSLRPAAETRPLPEPVRASIHEFFLLLQSERMDDAFSEFLKGSRLAEQTESQQQFLKRTQSALAEYGPIRSYEFFDHARIGTAIRLVTYFAYVDSEPLRWQFFYETSPSSDTWSLINLRVDDLLDEALLEW